MRKSVNILLAFVVALFILPFTSHTALAEAEVYDNLKDGEYDITIKTLHADKEEESSMARYLGEQAKVTIEDGQASLAVTLHNQNLITFFQIEGKNAVNKETNEEENTREEMFEIDSLESMLPARVKYEVPGVMEGDHELRLLLEGLDKIPVLEEESEIPDETEDPKEDDPKENGKDKESDEPTIELNNGSYTMNVSYLKSDNNDPSSMGNYMEDTVFITVEDDKAEVTITVNAHNTVTKLLVDGKQSSIAKLDGDKRYETFKIDNLDSITDAYVEYEAPFQGGIHKGNASFRIAFDKENLVEATAKEQPGYNIEEVLLNLDDGFYTISASYVNSKDGSNSAMGNYLDETVFVSFEEGKVLLTITVNNDETVTKLQVNDKDAVEKIVDGEKRYETFEFDDLLSLLNAYVEYEAPFQGGVHKGQADFIIALDAQNLKSAKSSDKPGAKKEEPKEEKPVEDPKEDPKEEPQEEPKEEPETPIIKDEKSELIPEKAYAINYVIKHKDGVQNSTANDFFTGKAILLEKDGKKYVQLTITNGDMVKELSNKYGDALLIKENKDGSIVVQLRVDNTLSDMLLNMRIVVPGLYDSKHEALLVFDKDSKEEIDPTKQKLAGTNNPDNQSGPLIENNGTPPKPDLGDVNKQGEEIVKADKTDNPQTGDRTNIYLYVMLFIGSLIPLAVKARKRFG